MNIHEYTRIHTNIFKNTNCQELFMRSALPLLQSEATKRIRKNKFMKICGSFMIIHVEKRIICDYSCLFMLIRVEKKKNMKRKRSVEIWWSAFVFVTL